MLIDITNEWEKGTHKKHVYPEYEESILEFEELILEFEEFLKDL